jgi:hypothetical protein
MVVIPRACGVSSTPRLLGFIISVSGMLGRPVEPGDDDGGRGASAFDHFRRHNPTFSRRDSPEVCPEVSPLEIRGRRECRMRAAPAVPCAKWKKKTHTSIQVQRRHSDIPCAMALRITSRSPRRIGLVCLRRLRIWLIRARSGRRASEDLTPTIEASGPHDFTVRTAPFVSAPSDRSRVAKPALHHVSRLTLPRPPHPAPRL